MPICQKCHLSANENIKMVRGKGPLDADLMLVGEAPGYEENKAGEPFIGSAGRLLTKHLNEVGISREDTYITNVVKCQPPGNRNPTHSEMMACKEHLLREIVSVRPKIIVLMGRIAIKALSGRTGSMKDLHGVVSHMTIAIKDDVDSLPVEVVVVLTYHPAAELYHEFYTQFIQEDWKKIKQLLDEKKKEKKVTVQIPLNVDNEKQLKEQKKFLEGSDERRT